MALNNILPQYQADERSAEVRIRPVPMPNHMDMAGRMLSQAGGDIQKAVFGLALDMKRRKDALDAEEDDLAVTQALNGFTEEMVQFTTEQSHRLGADADGNTKRLDERWRTAAQKWGANLSAKGSRAFSNRIGQMHPTYWRASYEHEYEQTTRANIQGKTVTLNNEVNAYSMYGGSDALARVEGAAKDVYLAQYGTLDEEGAAWKNFRQQAIDQSISARTEVLVNQGNIERAVEFYNDQQNKLSDTAKAKLQPMLQKVQRNEINLRSASVRLGNINAQYGLKSLNGRYDSPERQLAFAKEVQELAGSTDPNDKIVLQYLQQAFDADTAVKAANLTLDLSERTSALVVDDSTDSLFRNIKLLDIELPTLPDSQLRDKLQTMRDKMVDEADRRFNQQQREIKAATSEAKAEAREAAAEEKAWYTQWEKSYPRQVMAGIFKAGAARSDHRVTLRMPDEKGFESDQPFDLSNEKQRNLFFLLMDWGSSRDDKCLTDEDKRVITAIATGQVSSGDYQVACTDIAKKLKKLYPSVPWDEDKVVSVFPELVDEYISFRAEASAGGKNPDSAIRGTLDTWLTNKFLEERDMLGEGNWRYWWPFRYTIGFITDDRYMSGEDFFKDALDEHGKINEAKTYSAWLKLHTREEMEPESVSKRASGDRYGEFDATFGGN